MSGEKGAEGARHRSRGKRGAKRTDERKEEKEEAGEVLKGVLQCVLNVGAFSIFVWICCYYFYYWYMHHPVEPSTTPPMMTEAPGGGCSAIDNVKLIIQELKDIPDWKLLGEELEVPQPQLANIDADKRENEHKKRAVIRAWFDGTAEPCWENIVGALVAMEKIRLAQQLCDKYGCSYQFVEKEAKAQQPRSRPSNDIFDKKPAVSEFQLIRYVDGGEKKELRLIDEIATNWRKLGSAVGLSIGIMDGIHREKMGNQEESGYAVLQKWLQGGAKNPNYPVSWNGLMKVLDDILLGEVAKELKVALSTQSKA